MRIVPDSNEFIFGILKTDSDCAKLIGTLTNFETFIPKTVVLETRSNLSEIHINLVRLFYRLIRTGKNIKIIDELDVPKSLVEDYKNKGLKDEDAEIGAFTEWVKANYLITENRHFLKNTNITKFKILTAKDFLKVNI